MWRAGFIWDDDDHLTANPAMAAPHGLRMIWSSLAVSRYYPLTLTDSWFQRRLWGLSPRPYHVVNVALHAVNGVLLYFVLRRLRIRAAWLAAMLWVLHPVNVESAAWITELKNAQSGVFFFLAVLCFLRSECPAAGYPETKGGIPPDKTGEKSAGDSDIEIGAGSARPQAGRSRYHAANGRGSASPLPTAEDALGTAHATTRRTAGKTAAGARYTSQRNSEQEHEHEQEKESRGTSRAGGTAGAAAARCYPRPERRS